LNDVDLAIERVKQRVSEGGHNIPEDVIKRRYRAGIQNLINLYKPTADTIFIFDNSDSNENLIAELTPKENNIFDSIIWQQILNQSL
jgi:predicted ABC-type ATPase